jgi:hypothetical protein
MVRRMTTVPWLCDALVDQNRYIGKDPVGYKCSRPAAFEHTLGFLLCEECREMLDSGRITVPSQFGREYQKAVFDSVIKN